MMSIVESWFIPCDILMIIIPSLAMILGSSFLLTIILDKTCHTASMMLIANSCLTGFLFACSNIALTAFTLKNDLKEIQYEDSYCVFRGYFGFCTSGLFNTSFSIQAIYRYIIIVYPNRLFFQTKKFQLIMLCLAWLYNIVHPILSLLPGEMPYNVDNQICQVPLQLSFSIIYTGFFCYLFPMSIIIIIYFKLIRYVHEMGKRVTPVNTLTRAQRQLKMVQRIVIITIILVTVGAPYCAFMVTSFFTTPPKYHFRIAYLFVDISTVLVLITLFQFTDQLKESVMKKLNRRPNTVVAVVT